MEQVYSINGIPAFLMSGNPEGGQISAPTRLQTQLKAVRLTT